MKFFRLRACLLVAVLFCASAFAHKPLLSVDDNEDGTIYIEVGFSDGSSGAGHELILKDKSGKVINQVKVPEESSIDIEMPKVPYDVTFSAGEGHMVTVDGPFSEQAAEPEEVAEESAAVEAQVAPAAPVASTAVISAPAAAQPVIIAAPASNAGNSPGFNMALKMMITTNIIIAVFVAFLLVMCSFGIGYSIGKSKKS